MGSRGLPAFWLLAVFPLAVCLGMESAPGDPAATVKSLLDAVRVLSGAEDTTRQAQAVKQISRTFDVEGLSRACLRDTWNRLPEQERRNFVNLFREILEKVAYPKSAKFFKDTEVEVEDVNLEGGKAEVSTLVFHPEEGEVEVAYCLEMVRGRWLIEDILLDGVSLRMDLRSQVQKILREESYEELKRRMRKKLTE